MPRPDSLFVQVKSPQKIVFTGEVKAVSSLNENGRFDLLPQHANFITIIKDVLVIYDQTGRKQELKIGWGILKVSENIVQIFLDI